MTDVLGADVLSEDIISNNLAEKLARAEIVAMTPYQSARRLFSGSGDFNSKTWLNANEASGAGEYQISADCINRYPDFQPSNLLNAYSNYCKLPLENILATRGADEGIELIIRTFCKPYSDNILICPPTYGMYAISAENHGAGIISVPMVNNELDIQAIKSKLSDTKVIFACSPGNPTGNLLPKEQIIELLELTKDQAIVVVDEAYIEFCSQHTAVELLDNYPQLIILRTLSKAFALAGLRCGFTLASTDIIAMLSKVIAPYPISAPVAEIASQALNSDGILKMQNRVVETTEIRAELIMWLKEQSWCEKVFKSDANFVLFKTEHKQKLFDALVAENILIRDQSKQLQLENCLRISIGSVAEINAVKQVLSQVI